MIKKAIKKALSLFDRAWGTNLCEKASDLKSLWDNSDFVNGIRRKRDVLKIRIKFLFGLGSSAPLKLHLGCGSQHFDGYVNIDVVKTPASDIICDVTRLPYPDNSAAAVECYHLLEHLPVCLMANIESRYGEKYASLIGVLKDWRRVLVPNGKLIIEVPDFDKLVQDYIAADDRKKEEMIIYLYGGYRNENIHDIHRWGPNKYRLRYILEQAGFSDIQFTDAKDHHKELMPCLRVECTK